VLPALHQHMADAIHRPHDHCVLDPLDKLDTRMRPDKRVVDSGVVGTLTTQPEAGLLRHGPNGWQSSCGKCLCYCKGPMVYTGQTLICLLEKINTSTAVLGTALVPGLRN
jgi:hypothetical protein